MCESSIEKEMALMGVLPAQNGAPESLESDYSIIPEPHLVNGEEIGGNFDTVPNLQTALLSATPDLSLEELQSHLADVVQENLSLKAALEKNNQMIHQQLQQLKAIMAWHDDLTTSMSKQQLELKEAQQKVSNLEKENEELKNKVTLQAELKRISVADCAVSTGDNITSVGEEEIEYEIVNRKDLRSNSELKLAHAKIAEMTEVMRKQTEKIKRLEKPVDHDTKEDLKNISPQQLIEKIKMLKDLLETKQKELEDERNEHMETMKKLSVVQTNYDRVTRLLQIQAKDENKKKFDEEEREKDTRMYLEKIDDLTVKLLSTEESLDEKERVINALTSEIEALKADSESVPILKAQLELYKNDLDTLSLAESAAKEEVNRLTRELHETSLSLCDSCGNIDLRSGQSTSKGRGKKSMPSLKPISVKQGNNMYICPICSTACPSILALEKHANQCIDQSMKRAS